MWKNLLLVGVGGFLGSIARYIVALVCSRIMGNVYPFGTFIVNILGSFLIGFIYSITEEVPVEEKYRLFLATGFCGGFTTFSAFSTENLFFLEEQKYLMLSLYAFGSLFLGILMVFLGVLVGRMIFHYLR